jgi:hypothetical protein
MTELDTTAGRRLLDAIGKATTGTDRLAALSSFRQWASANAEALIAAAEERDRLRYLVETIEWVQPFSNSYPTCPKCGEPDHIGHVPECPLRAALSPSPALDDASEYGRLLAERDRLIADGVDPEDLPTPEVPR